MLSAKLLSGIGVVGGVNVKDVFISYLYTGNGSTQTINNGIDLASKGGMVWVKSRDTALNNELVDTVRGATSALISNSTLAYQSYGPYFYNTNGFSFGGGYVGNANSSSVTYASWTFRKSPKFFDVVTYTGNGVNVRRIAHSLGADCRFAIIKRTDVSSNWLATYSDGGVEYYLLLNSTANGLDTANRVHGYITMDSQRASNIALLQGTDMAAINALGGSYVAYLFAHDQSAYGIVQVVLFTTDVSGNASVNHGWVYGVQFAIVKASSASGDWEMYDTSRTTGWSGSDARLRSNLSNSEDSVSRLSASGTSVTFTGLSAGTTYMCLLIKAS